MKPLLCVETHNVSPSGCSHKLTQASIRWRPLLKRAAGNTPSPASQRGWHMHHTTCKQAWPLLLIQQLCQHLTQNCKPLVPPAAQHQAAGAAVKPPDQHGPTTHQQHEQQCWTSRLRQGLNLTPSATHHHCCCHPMRRYPPANTLHNNHDTTRLFRVDPG